MKQTPVLDEIEVVWFMMNVSAGSRMHQQQEVTHRHDNVHLWPRSNHTPYDVDDGLADWNRKTWVRFLNPFLQKQQSLCSTFFARTDEGFGYTTEQKNLLRIKLLPRFPFEMIDVIVNSARLTRQISSKRFTMAALWSCLTLNAQLACEPLTSNSNASKAVFHTPRGALSHTLHASNRSVIICTSRIKG